MRIGPSRFYREICRVSPLLGVRAMSQRHFSRIYSEGRAATTSRIFVIVAAARSLSRLPVRASDLFDLEPASGALADELLVGHPDPARGDTAPLSVFWRPRHLRPGGPAIVSHDPTSFTAPELLETLYRAHGPLMMTVARVQWSLPPTEAEEIVHEIFLSFLERQPQVTNMRAFLLGATRNACKYYWRKQGRETELPEDLADAGEDRRQARWPLLTTLVVALAQMGPRCRETLQSFYTGGETPEEIAKRLNVSPAYVYQILHGCREQLRDMVIDPARRIG